MAFPLIPVLLGLATAGALALAGGKKKTAASGAGTNGTTPPASDGAAPPSSPLAPGGSGLPNPDLSQWGNILGGLFGQPEGSDTSPGQSKPGDMPAPGVPGMPQIPTDLGGLFPGSAPADNGGKWYYTEPKSGLLATHPSSSAAIMAQLAGQVSTEVHSPTGTPSGPMNLPGMRKLAPAPFPNDPQKSALVWAQQEARSKGRFVLMSTNREYVASVAVGQEKLYCQPSANLWVIVYDAEPVSKPAPQGSSAPTIPGTNIPLPSGLPTAPGGLDIPAIFSPGGGGGSTTPASTDGSKQPDAGSQQPQPTTPTPPAAPDLGSILGGFLGQQPTTTPGASAPSSAERMTPAGAWPVSHVYEVEKGTTPASVAEFYLGKAGAGMGARKIRDLNNLQTLDKDKNVLPASEKNGPKAMFFSPWYGGQVVALPKEWDTSKGWPKGGSPKGGTTSASSSPKPANDLGSLLNTFGQNLKPGQVVAGENGDFSDADGGETGIPFGDELIGDDNPLSEVLSGDDADDDIPLNEVLMGDEELVGDERRRRRRRRRRPETRPETRPAPETRPRPRPKTRTRPLQHPDDITQTRLARALNNGEGDTKSTLFPKVKTVRAPRKA